LRPFSAITTYPLRFDNIIFQKKKSYKEIAKQNGTSLFFNRNSYGI
jgi:hypothetical protein